MTINNDIKKMADTIQQTVPAERIYLFGSYAYGTPNEYSDYDFFVVIPDGEMRPMEAMQKSQLALARSMRRRVPVDILASTVSDFEHMRDLLNTVEKQVYQEGVLLFERKSAS